MIPIWLPTNAHVNLADALMFPSTTTGQRHLISQADLMANCQISQFSDCLAGAPIPEPSATMLFAVGVLVTATATRRRTPAK